MNVLNYFMELSKITKKYFKDEDWEDLNKASNIANVYEVALRVLSRMPENLSQVCGPITTGGKGSIEDNLEEFNNRIKELQESGVDVFDQMPFEEPMHRIMLDFQKTKNEYMNSILDDFYLPLFKTNKIKQLYFIPGWKSSKGSCWEHDTANKLGIKINYL